MNSTEFTGYLGEIISIIFLKLKGYKILAHRYKTRCGEIDIIAFKKDIVVFAEVKSRKNLEKCHMAIHHKQINRIKNASQIFMRTNKKFTNYFTRFDVILITGICNMPQHIKNISI